VPQTRQQRVGQWGEAAAARYLERRGFTIVARNMRTSYGEIDLIARHPQGELVFVEVKTRTSENFGFPEEAVNARKLEHLVSAAQAYLLKSTELTETNWRIDVVAVQGRPGIKEEDVRIEHFENIAT
jgi:putative endonuclease